MAEAPDRPHDSEPVPSNAAPAEERIATQPQSLAAPGGEVGTIAPPVTETYRPLSLLALAGFGLAIVYALVVLIGAAVALFSHIPWLMPSWAFLLPLAAVVLCWVARTHIRNSEGTLSGQTFTTWGLRLAIVVALTYGAYYGATFFAVRGQAVERADHFFELIKQGQKEQAFALALEYPPKDMDSAELRNVLESTHNTSSGAPGSVGELTRFRQAQFVRLIEMGGTEAKINPQGVREWGYEKGGYRVVLRYHIETPMAAFEMNLETFKHDSKPGETKGGRWQVVLVRSETTIPPSAMKMKPHGKEIMEKARMAEVFALAWIEKVNQQQWSEAFLDTLASSERDGLAKPALRKGRKELQSGILFRIDENRFWAGKQQRDDILQRVRNSFQPESPTCMLGLVPGVTPLIRESEDRITVSFDANLRYVDTKTGFPQYIVLGQLLVTTREPDAANSASAWRVEAIDLESGRTPPAPRMPSKPPG